MITDDRFGYEPTSPPRNPFAIDLAASNSAYAPWAARNTSTNFPEAFEETYSRPPPLTASNSDPSALQSMSTILIRKLPRSTSTDTVNGMLMFSDDFVNSDIIRSPYAEDAAYTTAIARFKTSSGAQEAQAKLSGKSVGPKDTAILVEISSPISMDRRATIEGPFLRQKTSSTSSADSLPGALPPGRSRYGSTFQSADKISATFPIPDSTLASVLADKSRDSIQSLFSPTSPMSNGFNDRTRISGKSVINNDDFDDDETKELLSDPLAFAKSGQQLRRSSQAQVPGLSHFSRLSISTGQSSNHGNFPPPSATPGSSHRGSQALQPPHSPTNITNMNPGSPYNVNMSRPHYPPVNPADQNPPCNTLYVGNLPMDTSEDELKTIFSKARGYKRLCFRVKSNGPMCFVEFEDTTYASQALHDLYGYPLHNSVKGGIRLSYSKNPLGVRSGQVNGMVANGGYSPHLGNGVPNYMNNANNGNGNFKAVSGPPPGIISPPGFSSGNGYTRPQSQSATPNQPLFSNPFGVPGAPAQQYYPEEMNPRNFSGGLPPSISGKYGRDSRGSLSNFTMGR